ncbi:BTB/POZ domain-containing protein 6-B isoform X3 [Parasteatoda tepidariorum]|uniref:BTB/POZ domain-containing protein 6-B isoform X3 n=1 Tax=Parasteatoda tepidariorum TaxID=114398 RepID=UPI0039BC3A4C
MSFSCFSTKQRCLPNKIKKSDSSTAWRRKSQSKSKHSHRSSSTPPSTRPTLLLPPMTCTTDNLREEGNGTTAPVVTTRVQQSEDNSQNYIYHTIDNASQYTPRPEPSAPSPGHLFYNSEDHSDITFIVGPEEWRFPAHSFILTKSRLTLSAFLRTAQPQLADISSCSDNNTDTSPAQRSPIILKLPKLQPEVFEQILRYIYTGQVALSNMDTTLRLLYPCRVYHLPILTSHCLHYVSKNVNTTNVLVVLSHLLYPNIHHPALLSSNQSDDETSQDDCHDNDNERNELVFKCLLIVDRHADDILQSELFETLEHELMVEIIKRDSLEVSSEAVVFDSVMRWACRACKKQRKELTAENKCSVLGKALFLVRYLTMTSEEFLRGPVSQGVLSKEDKEILLSRLTNDGTPVPDSSLPDRWSGWKISVKREKCHSLLPISSPRSELVSNSSELGVSSSNSIQPVKSDRKKKSMSKKLLNGVGDLVICVIQLLD